MEQTWRFPCVVTVRVTVCYCAYLTYLTYISFLSWFVKVSFDDKRKICPTVFHAGLSWSAKHSWCFMFANTFIINLDLQSLEDGQLYQEIEGQPCPERGRRLHLLVPSFWALSSHKGVTTPHTCHRTCLLHAKTSSLDPNISCRCQRRRHFASACASFSMKFPVPVRPGLTCPAQFHPCAILEAHIIAYCMFEPHLRNRWWAFPWLPVTIVAARNLCTLSSYRPSSIGHMRPVLTLLLQTKLHRMPALASYARLDPAKRPGAAEVPSTWALLQECLAFRFFF